MISPFPRATGTIEAKIWCILQLCLYLVMCRRHAKTLLPITEIIIAPQVTKDKFAMSVRMMDKIAVGGLLVQDGQRKQHSSLTGVNALTVTSTFSFTSFSFSSIMVFGYSFIYGCTTGSKKPVTARQKWSITSGRQVCSRKISTSYSKRSGTGWRNFS